MGVGLEINCGSQLMAGSPPSPFDQHPFCLEHNTAHTTHNTTHNVAQHYKHCAMLYRTHCSVRTTLGVLGVGFSPRLFVSVRGCSLSETCLYPLFLSSLYTTFPLHSSFVHSVEDISILVYGQKVLLVTYWVQCWWINMTFPMLSATCQQPAQRKTRMQRQTQRVANRKCGNREFWNPPSRVLTSKNCSRIK